MTRQHIIHRFCTIALMFVALLHLLPASAQNDEKTNKTILIINTHNNTSSWSNELIPQIINMGVCNPSLEIYSESMNMMLIDSQQEADDFKTYLFEKYTNSPDVVILLSSSALILLPEIQAHWNDVSIVLCSEESYASPTTCYLKKIPAHSGERIPISLLARKYNLTHLLSPINLKGTVDQMHYMNPAMNRLLLLTDTRSTSRQIEHDLKELLASDYPDLKLEMFVAGELTTRALLKHLNAIAPHTTGVLFSSWYHISHTAHSRDVETNTMAIIANTPVPIYTLRNATLREGGFVGAYTIDPEKYNLHLTNVLEQILNGSSARNISFYYPNDFRPRFNYHTMQYFGIDTNSVPAEAEIIGQTPSFWQAYSYQIIAAILLFISGLVFVSLQRKRIMALNKLHKAERKELELIAEHMDLIQCMPIIYARGRTIHDKNDILVDVLLEDVNPAFRQMFPDLGQSEGCGIKDLFPRFLPTMLSFMRKINDKNRTCVIPFYADNRKRFFEIIISRTSHSEMLDIFCIDCTNLHEAQAKLTLINHKLGMALEVSNITPWKWDLVKKMVICDVNQPEGDEYHLIIPEDQYFSKIYFEDKEHIRNAYNDLLEGRTNKVHEEYRFLQQDGTEQRLDWIEVQAAVDLRNPEGQPLSVIGSSLIITARKNMEHQLVTAMERAEESNRLKSAFLANMSHEIRTPLNAIVGFSAMLADADTEEEKREYLTIIRNNNDLLLQLIGDILDLSKIEAGTLDFPYSDIKLNQLMFEVESTMRIRLHNPAVELSFDNPDTECAINTSSNRVTQVLINLLTNSVKFTQRGSIHFGYQVCENMLRFYVTDTGCGIPQDKLHTIFERFVKLNSFEQGTGLGLAICQTIVEHMGGKIGVEAEEGKGSTFWFTIPYCPSK